jgi:NAD-dependent dihydropyrimidine dehydrogenase PreA subunit
LIPLSFKERGNWLVGPKCPLGLSDKIKNGGKVIRPYPTYRKEENMKIDINAQACGDPLDCRLCLDKCPEKVFGTYPRKGRKPGVAAGDWVIFPIFASQCTGCMDCVDFCPHQAISVLK